MRRLAPHWGHKAPIGSLGTTSTPTMSHANGYTNGYRHPPYSHPLYALSSSLSSPSPLSVSTSTTLTATQIPNTPRDPPCCYRDAIKIHVRDEVLLAKGYQVLLFVPGPLVVAQPQEKLPKGGDTSNTRPTCVPKFLGIGGDSDRFDRHTYYMISILPVLFDLVTVPM